ncbi:MAG: hypothetical protein Q8O76_05335 [Chloroflexota bacterium]|nr:hypothetical protein [Chloroflexota bacterium]
MRQYKGREMAPQGVYLNLSTWELVQLHEKPPVLPGGSEIRYVKLPGPMVMVLAPLAGLALVVFLPLIGILGLTGFLAYKVGRGVWGLGRRAVQPVATGWKPGMAYLTKRPRTPEGKEETKGAEGELKELEDEVTKRRQRGEE